MEKTAFEQQVEMLILYLLGTYKRNSFWQEIFEDFRLGRTGRDLHLVVSDKDEMERVIDDRPLIVRAYKTETPPFADVKPCDILLLKKPGQKIEMMAQVQTVSFFEDFTSPEFLKVEEECNLFLDREKASRFLTIIWLDRVTKTPATQFKRPGRQPWVVLPKPANHIQLELFKNELVPTAN